MEGWWAALAMAASLSHDADHGLTNSMVCRSSRTLYGGLVSARRSARAADTGDRASACRCDVACIGVAARIPACRQWPEAGA
ncbi:hypothetical protein [Azospirillum largimobile]